MSHGGISGSCGTTASCWASSRRRSDRVGRSWIATIAVELDQAGDRPKQRRLAGAVRPDQRDPLALGDLEVDVVDDDLAAEPHGHAADVDGAHRAPPREVRRTIAKNGAPTNAVTMPIGSSAGSERRARDDVGEDEKTGTDDRREGQQPSEARPDHEPHRVRDDDPDEADQPAHRNGRCGADRRREDEHEADAPDVDAEARGLDVADAEHVEDAPVHEDDDRGDERRTGARG